MNVDRGGPWPLWIFRHDTDKVEGGLMVLFFGLVFSVAPPNPQKYFLPKPLNGNTDTKALV